MDTRNVSPRSGSTRHRFSRGMVGRLVAVACLASTMAPAVAGDFALPLAAPEPAADDQWQFGFGMYGWMAGMKGTTITGSSFDVEFDQILDSLNMATMMAFSARKGRWSFGSDLLYLDIGTDVYSMRRGPVRTSVDLKAWIVSPMAGYTALEGDWGRLDVLAGARYLYMKSQLGVTEVLPLATPSVYTVDSASSWAAIVGIRGELNLPGKWYVPYYLDMGTGDPDFTWQAFLGVGYRFENFNLVLGYRYLDWEFDSSSLIQDLDVSGPMLGATFQF